ncbi:MAG: transporter substrate-binding domain-containing protein [Albidovulum sp.]
MRTRLGGLNALASIEKRPDMEYTKMLKTIRQGLVPFCIAVTLIGSSASAQQECSTYTVQKGDTLGSISKAAFGFLDYQTLFNVNIDAIGDNPNQLEPGITLIIPCKDGRKTADVVLAPIDASEGSSGSDATIDIGEYKPKIKFLTGGDWYPFADEGLSGGGFLIRLTSNAMRRAAPDRSFSIDWVDDWDSHLSTLLPFNAFDISVAWYAPDCSDLSNVSDLTREFCEEFDFSDPLYDAVFGFFAAKDNPYADAKTFSELAGARICRPEGYSLHDLDAEGLIEPVITVSIPAAIPDCFEGLLNGTYDIATVESQATVSVIKDLGIADQVVENTYITSIQSIAAMSHKSNKFGKDYLAMMNSGLLEMRESGEWYDVIATSLKEANDKLNAQ